MDDLRRQEEIRNFTRFLQLNAKPLEWNGGIMKSLAESGRSPEAICEGIVDKKRFENYHCSHPDPERLEERICAICQDIVSKSATKLSFCGHVFCDDCIQEWTGRPNTCPCCRRRLFNTDFEIWVATRLPPRSGIYGGYLPVDIALDREHEIGGKEEFQWLQELWNRFFGVDEEGEDDDETEYFWESDWESDGEDDEQTVIPSTAIHTEADGAVIEASNGRPGTQSISELIHYESKGPLETTIPENFDNDHEDIRPNDERQGMAGFSLAHGVDWIYTAWRNEQVLGNESKDDEEEARYPVIEQPYSLVRLTHLWVSDIYGPVPWGQAITYYYRGHYLIDPSGRIVEPYTVWLSDEECMIMFRVVGQPGRLPPGDMWYFF